MEHYSVNGKNTRFRLVKDLAGAMVIVPLFLSVVQTSFATEICDRLQTASTITFSEQTVGAGTIMYQSVFSEKDWAGDLVATCLDARGQEASCQCADQSGVLGDCDEFMPGFPEIKWSADTIAWNIDVGLNKDPDDGWWNRRRVITFSPLAGGGVPFRYDSLGDEQRGWLRYDPDLLHYIRGDRSLEPERFRSRSSYYGDFINSVPVSYGSVLIAGANDGMLHVFDKQSGHEYFSYVPNATLSQVDPRTGGAGGRVELLATLGDTDYQDNHRYSVDGTVSVRYLDDQATTLVPGALGRGGKGVFGLNIFGLAGVDDPEGAASDIVMWEYPDATRDGLQPHNGILSEVGAGTDESADLYDDSSVALAEDPWLGAVYGKPQIVRLPYPEAPGFLWAVVFANGYLSYNQTPVLYVLDAYDGSLIKRIFTTKRENSDQSGTLAGCAGSLGCNGLSTPELVDTDGDGIVDYGYGGDLRGNLWKFDFTAGDIYGADGYIVSYHDSGDLDENGSPAPRPLIAVRDELGNPQPITEKPTVTLPCATSAGGLMVLFGTGLVDGGGEEDRIQSLYGIWDWQELWRSNPDLGIDPASAWFGTVGASVGDGTTRQLNNLSSLLATNQAAYIGLLEQDQRSVTGIRFDDGVPGAGLIDEIVEDPVDYNDFDEVVRTLSNRPISWLSAADLEGGLGTARHVGWVFDLALPGEQLAGEPTVFDGVLYYATSTGSEAVCSGEQRDVMLMAQNSCTGAGTTDVVIDLNGDGWLNSKDSVAVYEELVGGQETADAAAGVLRSGGRSTPAIVSSRGRDMLYTPEPVSETSVELSDDGGNLADHLPEVSARTVRGRNLGMSFWRELF